MADISAEQERELLARSAERAARGESARYGPLSAPGYMAQQEKIRALIRCLKAANIPPVYDKRVLEVGAGTGDNLLILLQLGFFPGNLVGNDLDESSLAAARYRLPSAITLMPGDAADLKLEPDSFDIVLQSTVFSSILAVEHRQRLADVMWTLCKPGGGILWYDFTYNNPSNPQVHGMPVSHIRELFPAGHIRTRRVTLAPPINRRLTARYPTLYPVLNALPFLRTHVLCWIAKPA